MTREPMWKSPIPARRALIVMVDEAVITRALRAYLNMPKGDFSGFLRARLDGEYEFAQSEDCEITPNDQETS